MCAIVTGHMARGEIRRNPHWSGDGLAVGGWAGPTVVLWVLALLAFLLFFGGRSPG
jgi:hypothetical protein